MCFLITAPQAYRRALQQMDFTPGTTGRGGRESAGAKRLIAALARNDNTPGSVTHFSIRRETAHGPKRRFAAMRNFGSCKSWSGHHRDAPL